MNIVDVVIILVVLLYVITGFKRGVIKTGVSLIGTFVVLILSYVFKDYLASFLIKTLPFFDFGGVFSGITAMNVLVYELVSFIVIFVVLYCLLNILISLSGLVEKILELTIILAIPSKILGALLGLIEGVVMAFLIAFILLQLAPTEQYVMDSKVAIVVLERTPIIGSLALDTTMAMEEINNIVNVLENEEDRDNANAQVLQILVSYKIIDCELAQEITTGDDAKITSSNTITIVCLEEE